MVTVANQTWQNLLDPFPAAVGTTKASFSTLQDVAGVAGNVGSLPTTLPHELKVGTRVELEAFGEFSSLASATIALAFLYNATPGAAGGTTLALSSTITVTGTPAGWMFHMHYDGIVTAIGASGSIYGHGIVDVGTSLTALTSSPFPITQALRTVAIDTTVKAAWGVGWVYGASNASNTVTVGAMNAIIRNQGKTG